MGWRTGQLITYNEQMHQLPRHTNNHHHHQVGRVRGQLQELLSYDWLSVPLVYTQTVSHDHHHDDNDDNAIRH